MKRPIIDAHIHFDKYSKEQRRNILTDMTIYNIAALISVSWDLESAQKNALYAKQYKNIKPAFGFHPEQPLLSQKQFMELKKFIQLKKDDMVAIGEVGLPYYLRQENPSLNIQPYIDMLESFIQVASDLKCPIILHAIYDDAPIVCELLEKYNIRKAHFHWFKGDNQTIQRMITNKYFISITPDIFYKVKTQKLVYDYPLHLMMVETDGPWAFKGPLNKEMTHPKMIHKTIKKISEIKKIPINDVYQILLENTTQFYEI